MPNEMCRSGLHPMSGENLIHKKSGTTMCRACKAERHRYEMLHLRRMRASLKRIERDVAAAEAAFAETVGAVKVSAIDRLMLRKGAFNRRLVKERDTTLAALRTLKLAKYAAKKAAIATAKRRLLSVRRCKHLHYYSHGNALYDTSSVRVTLKCRACIEAGRKPKIHEAREATRIAEALTASIADINQRIVALKRPLGLRSRVLEKQEVRDSRGELVGMFVTKRKHNVVDTVFR